MSDETKHTQTPEAEARAKGVKDSSLAEVYTQASKPSAKATAEKETQNKSNEEKERLLAKKEEEDDAAMFAELKKRIEEEQQEVKSITDLIFEQHIFAQLLVSSIHLSIEGMSGDKAPFTRSQREWTSQFINRRLVQLDRDQRTMNDKLTTGNDDAKHGYIEARNKDRKKLALLGLGAMAFSKNSAAREAGRRLVMKEFFTYAFNSTLEIQGKNPASTARFSTLNSLYSLILIEDASKETVQRFFGSLDKNIYDMKDDKEEEEEVELDENSKPIAPKDPQITMYRDVKVPAKDKAEHEIKPPVKPTAYVDTTERGAVTPHVSATRVENGVSNNPQG
ncbi:MAG: hypothetical protein WCO78_00930 [Candidatus Roizmanbacteria bacterium]